MKITRIQALEVTFADSLSQTCRLLFDVFSFVLSCLPSCQYHKLVFVSIVQLLD